MTLLFPKEELPRTRSRRVMMHIINGGCDPLEPGRQSYEFKCLKCGHRPGWTAVDSVTEARRGLPCPECNQAKDENPA